jgi:hypothetical protein
VVVVDSVAGALPLAAAVAGSAAVAVVLPPSAARAVPSPAPSSSASAATHAASNRPHRRVPSVGGGDPSSSPATANPLEAAHSFRVARIVNRGPRKCESTKFDTTSSKRYKPDGPARL